MAKQKRGQISVNGAYYADLQRKAKAMGVPVSWIVEASISRALGVTPSDPDIAKWSKAFRPT